MDTPFFIHVICGSGFPSKLQGNTMSRPWGTTNSVLLTNILGGTETRKNFKAYFFLCRKYQSSMQLLPSFSPGSDLVLYYVSTLQGDGHLFICFLPKSVYFSSVSQKLLFLGWLIPRSFLYSSKNCQGISTWQIITVLICSVTARQTINWLFSFYSI